METARGDADHAIAGGDALSVDDRRPRDDADREAGEVVFARGVHAGQLRGLAAEQSAAGLLASLGDALHDALCDADLELARPEIVEEEQRPGAGRDDVVHAHPDEVEPDRVVDAGEERDLELRADTVGAAHEDGLDDASGHGAEAGKPADVAQDLGNPSHLCERLDALDELVPCVDVDPGLTIGDGTHRRDP